MRTMNAFVIPERGVRMPSQARAPLPEVGPDELLVRIKAIGVGIHDSYFLPQQMKYPYPIGIEAAGVIEEAGSATAGFRVGDAIAFVSMTQPKGGVWAEYAAVRADSLILRIPDGMSFEQAVAVPVAGNSALRALHALPDIPEGGSVFMAGASGAIGTFAIQLARRRGWEVAASASQRNHDHMTRLGAAFSVDYHLPDWPKQVLRRYPDGVHGALAIQPNTTEASMSVVRPGGTVVTVSGDHVVPSRSINVTGLAYGVDVRDEMRTLIGDVALSEIELVIEQVYPFAEALSALAKVQTRRARGKVVVSFGD